MIKERKSKNLIVSAILALVMCFLSIITLPINKAYATEDVKPHYETSSIEEDLESLQIDKTKTYDTVTLLYFLEYGYGYDSLYSIYLYTYIPLNQTSISEILYSSNKNTLTFGFTDNKDDILKVDYSKLKISTKPLSEDEELNKWIYKYNDSGVFVKWKVDLRNNDFILPNCADRYYCVSGIELQEKRKLTATEFLLGNMYHCYNNGKNDCVDRQSIDTVEVDVCHTFFRTGSSKIDTTLNSPWQNQISSCYFSLPKFIGNVNSSSLNSIKATFDYKYTKPILILGKDNGMASNYVYYRFSSLLGFDLENTSETVYFYSNFSQTDQTMGGSNGGYMTTYDFDLAYNPSAILKYFLRKDSFIGEGYNCWKTNIDYSLNSLYWLFYDEDLDTFIKDDKISEDYVFDGDNLFNYYEMYKNETWANNMFEDNETAKSLNLIGLQSNSTTELSYSVDDSGDITKITFANLISNNNGNIWQKLGNALSSWWKSLFNQRAYEIDEISPIEKVDFNDVSALTDEEFSKKYFVDINEVGAFKAYCREQQVLNKDVWLFRYDCSEYYSDVGKAFYRRYDRNNGITYINYDTVGFVARQAVYLNFDILEFGFKQDGKTYVIPAIHSPENVFNDLTAQQDPLDNELLDSLKLIVALILGAILVVIFWPFISPFIAFILKTVFKGIWFVIKGVFKVVTFILFLPFKIIFKNKKRK